jgi:hypothetical protein
MYSFVSQMWIRIIWGFLEMNVDSEKRIGSMYQALAVLRSFHDSNVNLVLRINDTGQH